MATIGVYEDHTTAENAVKELQKAGFDMKKVSVVGRDHHTEEEVVGYYNTGDRMKAWGKRGAFWGGIWGLLLGSAFFAVPGIGPIAVAGPLVNAIVTALGGAALVGGSSVLGAALAGLGIPENRVSKYESQIRGDKVIVVCHGVAEELETAHTILKKNGAVEVENHGESAG
jgi:uncharacterized membrane protein